MIVFDLECINGHPFEGWFEDSDTFEHQQENGLVSCPVCETTSVTRKLSAVAVKTSSSPAARERAREEVAKELGARIVRFVETNFENVGADFAREALKIHYGVSDSRAIRGTTTDAEDRVLAEEGVPVFKFPLPVKPGDDLN